MRSKDLRAIEYRRLAKAAMALAEASSLAHVREKHEHAAATWTVLALLDERPNSPAPGQGAIAQKASVREPDFAPRPEPSE